MSERRHGYYDEATETLTAAERRAFQESFLGPLVQFCYENSSHYRARMDEASVNPSDVVTLEDLVKVPVTKKHETQDLKFEALMTVPYNQARRIFVSPGPQFYAYGPIPQKLNPLLKVYHAVGFRPGDIVLNTFTYHLTPAGINFDESLGEFGCAVIPAGPGNTDLLVDVMGKLPVSGYTGTPSFLKILGDRARELDIDPRAGFSLECALTSAETLPETLRAEMEDIFGCIVRQLYGSADGLLPCFECWAADGMHVPEMMILEITDPVTGAALPPGEPGEVTASVFNPYRPLLRFSNGDRGMLVDEPCPCGRTAVRFRFLGRIDEAAKVRGMFVYPEQIAEALGRFPSIVAWRAIVEHDEKGLDVFRIECEGDARADEVAASVRALVRVRADVVIVPPGTIGRDGRRLEDKRTYD
ncbi:MAG TPA: AMP-binding protein [Actinomycetota bacterium]|nr:AMP-binding protein [Actinomycetota bacterium]